MHHLRFLAKLHASATEALLRSILLYAACAATHRLLDPHALGEAWENDYMQGSREEVEEGLATAGLAAQMTI